MVRMQFAERPMLKPATPAEMARRYSARAHGIKFEGPTVDSVFDQIDEHEHLHCLKAASYMVSDRFEGEV